MKILAVFAFLLATPAVAQAANMYTISGTGSGSLNGVSFSNSAFEFTLTGNASNLNGNVLDPLTSAVVAIDGYGPVTIAVPTRLGVGGSSTVYFGRGGIFGRDLFDFTASGVDLSTPFGPLTGTGVYSLGQFVDITTSGGLLTFSSSSDVQFAGTNDNSAVPEPATWAFMVLGFAAIGVALRFRRRTTTLSFGDAVSL